MKKILLFNDRLSAEDIQRFKLFPDERVIFALREHWLALIWRLMRQATIGITVAAVVAAIIFILLGNTALALLSFGLVMFLSSIVSIRSLIHWSFHIYIATTKQIIEVHYSPLFSQAVNSVLLDQIRCTEIDVAMFGIIPELIGIGNVELTFDRPTHKEQFIIKGIRSPRSIASLLSAQIHQANPSGINQFMQPVWTKELKSNRYRFLGEANYGFSTR